MRAATGRRLPSEGFAAAVMQDVPVLDAKTGEPLPDDVWAGVAANDNPRARRAQRTTCCPTPAIRRSSLVGRPLGDIVNTDGPTAPAREAQLRADLAGRYFAAATTIFPNRLRARLGWRKPRLGASAAA